MRYKERKVRLYFRGDAAFASPEIYEYLEAEGLLYVIRLKTERDSPAEHCPSILRDLSVARPTEVAVSTPFSYQAGSWNKKRRVVAKVSGTPASWFLASVSSSLICRALSRSIITVARRSSTSRKARTPSTGPVCHVASSATMPFGSITPNLGNFMRTLALPNDSIVETTLRDKLVKIGAKVVRWPLRYSVPIGEVAVPRDLFRKILSLIDDLRRRPASA